MKRYFVLLASNLSLWITKNINEASWKHALGASKPASACPSRSHAQSVGPAQSSRRNIRPRS